MRFDSLVISAVVREINDKAKEIRVDNIYQPQPYLLIISLQRGRDILLSAHPQNARIHLLARKYPNPIVPPSFCMQLRKYIRGSFLLSAEQVGWERIVKLHFSSHYSLVIEIMGKHSNVILLDEGENILGALRLVDETMSTKRHIIPKLPYRLPPTMKEKNPLLLSPKEWKEELMKGEGRLGEFLLHRFQGMSPFLVEEIAFRAYLPLDKALPLGEEEVERFLSVWGEIEEIVKEGKFQPGFILQEGRRVGFWAIPPSRGYEFQRGEDMSDVVEEFFARKEEEEEFLAKKKQMEDELRKEITRWEKIKEDCQQAMEEWKSAERYYEWGSLILMNLGRIRKGAESVRVKNIFKPDEREETIPLQKDLSPQQNAERYFALYRKGKSTVQQLEERIKETEEKLRELREKLEKVEQASSLEELEGERKEERERKRKEPQLPRVISSDGWVIEYGRNARQNELLFKSSAPEDIWLHARGAKGAHVVIRRQGKKEVPPNTLKEAAQIAAYLSSQRGANIVPVDWTLRKYVRKPRKSPQGFVTYTNEKTLFVKPMPLKPLDHSS